jgi:2-C-methyl-D-erythritol 2,4-cyclodiphosphate synthase
MKIGLGQDSHRFDYGNTEKKLVLGGVTFDGYPPLEGNSDSDAVIHSITNAVSGITCVNVLGAVSDEMCLIKGIKDSSAYLAEALSHLGHYKIIHISISIECLTPKITPYVEEMRKRISMLLDITKDCVGITATTGEGLTAFGRGEGIQVLTIITAAPQMMKEAPAR